MGILSTIFNKIFPSSHAAPPPEPGTPTAPGTAAAPAQPTSTPMADVDVEAVLTGLSNSNSQKLNWRTSIVDLLKLLGIDSSLESRKELAKELHFTGDTNDSAAMNIWLHRQVMNKLAANGGKVPADLRD